MPDAPKNICVYCGSSSGSDPSFGALAGALGEEIARAGHRLVYGGGHVGLMGIVADAVMAHGGEVTGVMTEQLVALEVAHAGLTSLDVQPDMHTRKARMAELADGVIALPGGFGTMDETFELLTWNQLGIVATPVVFLDVDGYYDGIFAYVNKGIEAGFMKPESIELTQRAITPAEAVELATAAPPGYSPKWVD